MRARISKRTVDKLQPGQAIADIDVNGFTARCLPSGTICYDLRYRTATGERRRLSLGLHGSVTPDQARSIAEKRLDDSGQGSRSRIRAAAATHDDRQRGAR